MSRIFQNYVTDPVVQTKNVVHGLGYLNMEIIQKQGNHTKKKHGFLNGRGDGFSVKIIFLWNLTSPFFLRWKMLSWFQKNEMNIIWWEVWKLLSQTAVQTKVIWRDQVLIKEDTFSNNIIQTVDRFLCWEIRGVSLVNGS